MAGIITSALPTTAQADSSPGLPLHSFGRMVVANGHIFISGGSQADTVLVTDLDGRTVTTLSNEPGADGLVASPDGNTVYAALSGSAAVAAISTVSLKETARYATPGVNPAYLAWTGGKLWFSYSSTSTTGSWPGIGSMDPSVSPAAVALKQTQESWSTPPDLAATPGKPGLLAAAELGSGWAGVYDVSTSPATTVVNADVPSVSSTSSLALTPDGADLILGSQLFRTGDLAPDGSYPVQSYARAVAVAPDGTVATGMDASLPSENTVSVFAPGGSVLLNAYNYTAPVTEVIPTVPPSGLAWAPDGHRLFAVTENDNNGYVTLNLHVLLDPEVAPSRLALTPSSARVMPAQTVTLTGTLTSTAPIAAGTVVHVTRTGTSRTSTTPTPLPDVAIGSDGSFTIADATTAEDAYTYTVSYGGDAGHRTATATAQVMVARPASNMQLTYPATSNRGAPLTVTGQLGNAPYPAGKVVRLTKSDQASQGTQLGTVAVNPDGSFSFTDTPQIGGSVTYIADYAGDPGHEPSGSLAFVDVSRLATTLSVTTDARTYASGAMSTITVHLGSTFNGRTVRLDAVPAIGRTVTWTATADAHGNVVEHFRLGSNTAFNASYAGDYRYAPATASMDVGVLATVLEAQAGYTGSKRYGHTLYRVYRAGSLPLMAATVSPNRSGGCVVFRLQEYAQGAWRSLATTSCYPLDRSSSAAVVVNSRKSWAGHLFRLDAVFRGDGAYATTAGAWQYFITSG
ncbi:YncE family protein [Streptacidiphilus jiangxiensis]|nr:hypothetical protein [Streptacidiphilus jiangxiensis]